MLSFYKKYYKTVFDIALIIVTIYLFMWLFSFLYKLVAPIFWSLVIFAIIEPLARFLYRRGIKKSIASAMSILLFLLIVLGIISGLGIIVITQTLSLMEKLPFYSSIVQTYFLDNIAAIQARYDFTALPPEVLTQAKNYAANLGSHLTQYVQAVLNTSVTMLTTFSSLVVNFVVGVILAYFLSVEIELWKRVANDKTPRTFKTAFAFLRNNVIKGIVSYIKAQAKLISITFAIVLISLLVLNVANSLTLAIISAIFDVLPLLGVSSLFIPWIIYCFVVGNTSLGIWLSVVLLIVTLFRQILEPKITGDSLGVSAFTMLSFMILSLSLFGVAGLIMSPILIITVKALYEQGYLSKWIRKPEEEYPTG